MRSGLVLFMILLVGKAFASNDTLVINTDSIQPEKPFVFIEEDYPFLTQIDSLMKLDLFTILPYPGDSVSQNIYGFPYDSVPVYPDSVIQARLEKLNAQTPMDLRYNNQVRGFIDLYANRRRSLVERVMGLSKLYFPMFEEHLDRYNIPLEMKYLAIVESALNPTARSRAGAVGLWQFMYTTGKIYDLNVTSYTDDRNDPIKQTQAACELFTALYRQYGDWNLVLAAYNSGPGNVNKAIRRSGGKRGYWEIQPYLPRETRGYVPAFIAVNYVMNHTAEHNLYAKEVKLDYTQVDTVHVHNIVAFKQLSEILGVDMETLHFLNPQYKRKIVPYTEDAERDFVLILPQKACVDFVNHEKEIYAYHQEVAEEEEIVVEENFTHIVRRGEYLGAIANKYKCGVSEIRTWNNLRNNNIYPGQKLVIYTANTPKPKTTTVAKATPVQSDDGKYLIHTVEKGDTLWDISKKYSGTSVEEIKRLNNFGDRFKLMPGDKIKVGVSG